MFYNVYKSVMDSRYNPLANIQDVTIRHLIMQILAWMWCLVFSFWMGSLLIFGVSAAVHAILIAGVFITVATFETARKDRDILVHSVAPPEVSTSSSPDLTREAFRPIQRVRGGVFLPKTPRTIVEPAITTAPKLHGSEDPAQIVFWSNVSNSITFLIAFVQKTPFCVLNLILRNPRLRKSTLF